MAILDWIKHLLDGPDDGSIDIMRTSASRPELFKASDASLRQNIQFSGRIRWMVHENFLNEAASKEVVRFAKEAGYDVILESNPSAGQCMGLSKLLRNVRAKYVLNFEDDWEVCRTIDLDLAKKILDENPTVNQIVFNKRDTMREASGLKKKEIVRSGHKLVTSPHWRVTPALWRMSYIRPRWITTESTNFIWILNDRLRGANKAPDADWMIKNIASFYLGGFDEKKYVRHIGGNQSVRLNERSWTNVAG